MKAYILYVCIKCKRSWIKAMFTYFLEKTESVSRLFFMMELVWYESFQIQIIERSYVKEVHRKYKYKLDPKVIPDSDKEVIITANGPSGLLPGMNYTTDFVISVVADKYISHMPLERQTREMESLGLKGINNSVPFHLV